MKHRLTVPWADDLAEVREFDRRLDELLRLCQGSWRMMAQSMDHRAGMHRPMMFLQLSPDFGLVAGITAFSGITIIYDDAEQSMGLTTVPEPQDAMPAFSFPLQDVKIEHTPMRTLGRSDWDYVIVTHLPTGIRVGNADQAEAFRELQRQVWELERQNPVITGALRDSITYEVATESQDETPARRWLLRTRGRGVPMNAEPEDERT